MFTGADLLVKCLYANGVRVLFGLPGSHTTALYDALARHGGIRTILVRNEQAAAFAADGYARVTGQPGVVCTTAGPGATNALTGVAEGFGDGVPVLLVAGHVNHDKIDVECGNYHEIDLESIFRPCTKFVGTIRANEQIPGIVSQAFAALTTGRRRSAAIFLPQDLAALGAVGDIPVGEPRDSLRSSRGLGEEIKRAAKVLQEAIDDELCNRHDGEEIKRAAKVLQEAERPVIMAGGGAVWSGAGREIRELAVRLDCPVVTTLNGKGILDERDPYSLGHGRSVRAGAALPHADAMLAVGCRFTEVFTWFHRKVPVPRRLVQIDIDPGQIGVNYPVQVGLEGDAKATLQALLEQIAPRKSKWADIWERARNAKPGNTEWFIDTLRATVPDDAVVFTDASEMALRMHTDWPAYAARTFFYPSNFIALGWGLPAAVGAAIALPDRWVVCVAGDGGFVMTCQELASAARYKLRLIVLIHNDSAYGAIKNLQKRQHDGRYLDTDLNNPDFVKLADAFGIPGTRASNATEMQAALHEALNRDGPSLIEVPDEWRSLRPK